MTRAIIALLAIGMVGSMKDIELWLFAIAVVGWWVMKVAERGRVADIAAWVAIVMLICGFTIGIARCSTLPTNISEAVGQR